MSLCAAGQVQMPPIETQYKPQMTPSLTAGGSGSRPTLLATQSDAIVGLTYLSAAIGALVQDNLNSSCLLVQLCTQVSDMKNRLKVMSQQTLNEGPLYQMSSEIIHKQALNLRISS